MLPRFNCCYRHSEGLLTTEGDEKEDPALNEHCSESFSVRDLRGMNSRHVTTSCGCMTGGSTTDGTIQADDNKNFWPKAMPKRKPTLTAITMEQCSQGENPC